MNPKVLLQVAARRWGFASGQSATRAMRMRDLIVKGLSPSSRLMSRGLQLEPPHDQMLFY